MHYQIWGSNLPAITLTLDKGEQLYTQSGGMTWMNDRFTMSTNMRGGVAKSFGRMFTGESLFMATYTATEDGAQFTAAASFPGQILAFEIDAGKELIAQKGAFLCVTPGVVISTAFSGLKSGLFGGEGFLLQRFSGKGIVFLEIDGSAKEITLAPGEKYKVNTGNVAVFESSVQYSSEMVKGFKNVLFGGEGLFLSTVTGPGRVWLQTMSAADLAGKLNGYIVRGN
jgi:uncharacterized protein (TIGR00266 family)